MSATLRKDLKMSSKVDSVSLLKWMMKKAKEKAAIMMIIMNMIMIRIIIMRIMIMIRIIIMIIMIMAPAIRMMKPKAALTILLVME